MLLILSVVQFGLIIWSPYNTASDRKDKSVGGYNASRMQRGVVSCRKTEGQKFRVVLKCEEDLKVELLSNVKTVVCGNFMSATNL